MKTNTMILVGLGIAAVAVYFVFFRESEGFQFTEEQKALGDSVSRSVGYVPITVPLQTRAG